MFVSAASASGRNESSKKNKDGAFSVLDASGLRSKDSVNQLLRVSPPFPKHQ